MALNITQTGLEYEIAKVGKSCWTAIRKTLRASFSALAATVALRAEFLKPRENEALHLLPFFASFLIVKFQNQLLKRVLPFGVFPFLGAHRVALFAYFACRDWSAICP